MPLPANDEMVRGYLDGRDPDAPEASANRSHSYRHGFANGRAELSGKRRGSFDTVLRLADQAMAADAAILGE